MIRVTRLFGGKQSGEEQIPRQMWVLVAAAFIIAIGYGFISPIIPQFLLSFGISMAAAGVVISVFAAARLVFAPGVGIVVDKLGSRWVYLSGLLIVAVTTGLIAVAQSYWQVVVLRALGGIGSTMFTVSAMSLIVQFSPPKIRGRCSSAYASGFLIGSILGPVLGSCLTPLGMRIPFLLYGLVVLLAAGVVAWFMPREHAVQVTSGQRLPAMRFGDAWRDPAYRLSLFSAFANGWTNFGARVAVLPLFAAATFERGAAAAGVALSVFALGNAVALQFSGKWADSRGRKPLIIAGLMINSVATGIFGLLQVFAFFLIASFVAGFGAGLFNPAQQAALADIVGLQRSGGKVLANFQMAQDFGAILSPILLGLLAESRGFAPVYLVCGLLTMFAAALWMFGRETLAPHDGEPIKCDLDRSARGSHAVHYASLRIPESAKSFCGTHSFWRFRGKILG